MSAGKEEAINGGEVLTREKAEGPSFLNMWENEKREGDKVMRSDFYAIIFLT